MKIILIPTCKECPHGAQWNLDGTEFMCGLATKINNFDNCKLKDALQFIKEFIKEKITP